VSQAAKSLNESVLFAPGGSRRLPNLVDFAAFAATAGLAIGVMVYFHDRSWWPPDDGAYAHVAERILNGEVLNRDVHDHHFGYVNLINAFWLWLFGVDLVSLRYPLAAMAIVQSCLAFRLLQPNGVLLASAGSIAMTALSVALFVNPTAHWYTLFVFTIIVCVLAWLPRDARWRLETLGYLVVTLILFRQLTGVFVAMGVVAYVLAEKSERARSAAPLLSWATICIMLLGLGGYLVSKTSPLAACILGIGPVAALIWAAKVTEKPNQETVAIGVKLALGGAAAALPLAAYHLVNGSLVIWFDDTVLSALYLTELSFVKQPSYAWLTILGAAQLYDPKNWAEIVNGLFWFALVLLPMVLGLAIARSLFSANRRSAAFRALPFLAVFYGLVSAHYEIPVYLTFSTAASALGLLALLANAPGWLRTTTLGLAIGLSLTALYFHAGQPLTRGMKGIVEGQRQDYVHAEFARAHLWMTPEDRQTYRDILQLIDRETRDGDSILAMPFNAELYFLSGRRNPTRFHNLAVGIGDQATLQYVLDNLREAAPRLVFHQPKDKYNTDLTDGVMDFVKTRYTRLPSIGGFDIYRLRPDVAAGAGPVTP
jgi:hypothetical protein